MIIGFVRAGCVLARKTSAGSPVTLLRNCGIMGQEHGQNYIFTFKHRKVVIIK
jgi:hypothetical protein